VPTVFDDPSCIDDLLLAHQPYWPVQRYMANRAEYATLSGGTAGDGGSTMPVAPVFRGDWAYGDDVRPGVEAILHHEPFVDAARRLFDAEHVRPHTLYVNLTWQLPFPQGRGHVDIPAFRGFDRSTVPVAFLTIMGQSGLFEEERVKVATAVAWFYQGQDGGFEYWPDGPQQPSVIHEGHIHNSAVVADNDFMWHRVRPTGRPEDGMVTLSLGHEIGTGDGHTWTIEGPGDAPIEVTKDHLRVSVSWKATVFSSDEDRRLHDDHLDDINAEDVLARLANDLADRGVDPTVPDRDPFRDPGFLARLQDTYMHYPT
jgi:hypothetical protein